MPTIPQRIASAFAVLCGRYGDVTEMAKDREQSRQSLYREAEQVVEAVDGTAAQARIDELQRQLAEQRAEVQALQERLKQRRRDHPRQAARVRHRRPGRGGQPERGPAAVAGRGRGRNPPRACRPWGGRLSRPASAPAPCSRCSTRRPGPRSNRPPPTRFFWPQDPS